MQASVGTVVGGHAAIPFILVLTDGFAKKQSYLVIGRPCFNWETFMFQARRVGKSWRSGLLERPSGWVRAVQERQEVGGEAA